MSKNTLKHIVLQRKAPFRRAFSAVPSLLPALTGIADVELREADLSKAEQDELRRDPTTVAIAQPMPLKLIEPVGSPEPTTLSQGNTWGVEAVGAHTSPFDGSGVVVAVLDTGINPTHQAFDGLSLVRRNFTTEGDDDLNGHGTHCAGTIFGRDLNGLRIGVARGVEKAVIGKVLGAGGGSSAELASAIRWAYENGANVISMSLGIDFPGYVKHLVSTGLEIEPATSMALEQYRANVNLFSSLSDHLAASNTFSQASVIVAASGNESERPRYEIAVSPPAAGDGLISVGALERSASGHLSVAGFSNTQCNLSGPGVSVKSAWIGSDDATRTIGGTSMAAPHVSGCAALWAQKLAAMGTLTNENLAAKVLATASFIIGASFDDIGNGMVQAPPA